MWSLPEILTINNPELALPETEHTREIKALNRRNALATSALAAEGLVLKEIDLEETNA